MVSKTRMKERANRKENPEKRELTLLLNKANSFWREVAVMLAKPRRSSVEMNVGQINKKTKDGEVIIVPGKVLSSGDLDHKLTLSAFSFAERSKEKMKNAKILSIKQMAEAYKDGKGVRVLAN